MDNRRSEMVWAILAKLSDAEQAMTLRHLFGSMEYMPEFLDKITVSMAYAVHTDKTEVLEHRT